MCERTLTHQFAKWAKVDNLAEAFCWMILKGGGKGVLGHTFKILEELQSLADSPDGAFNTTSDGGSNITSSLADINHDLENIVLDDDLPQPTSLQVTLLMAVLGTNGTAESATVSHNVNGIQTFTTNSVLVETFDDQISKKVGDDKLSLEIEL